MLSLNAAAATGRSCFSTVADPAGGGVLAALAAARARVESRIKDGVAGAMAGIASGDVVPGDGTSGTSGDGTSLVAAELAGAARVCATHSAKDVVHCLGGVHVLFPLLAPGALGSGDGARARPVLGADGARLEEAHAELRTRGLAVAPQLPVRRGRPARRPPLHRAPCAAPRRPG